MKRKVQNITADINPLQHFSLKKTILLIASSIFCLQVLVVVVLEIITQRHRMKTNEKPFPHPNLGEVKVGKNILRIYDYGNDLYNAMLEAIDHAQDSIFLETYLWKDDEIGRAFKEHLIQKAREGIKVYVVYDRFGNLVVPHEFKVFPPEVHALAYQTFTRPWHLIDPRHYALDHRKLLIVDGHIGFIGGYNIGSLYATEWRDTHLRISGPAVADLAQSFIEFWNQHYAKKQRITNHYQRTFDPLVNVRGTSALRLTFPIRDMYIEAIDKAEHTIRLSNAYFVPDGTLFNALITAAKRGVDVCVLVPWISNHRVVDWLTHGYFTACLKAGIHVYGYHNMLHAKTCTIDGQWSTIGTANLDRLSAVGNYEINVEVYSTALAKQMEQLFECDTTNAFEVTLDGWNKRPWYVIFSEIILSPLRFLM